MQFFSGSGARERNTVWHKGSLGDEDDAQTSILANTRERKHAMPPSIAKK